MADDQNPECPGTEHGCWNRSPTLRNDLLHIFVTGEMYDCCFKVGKGQNCKVFKCHKLILSTASSVFHAMLQGNFLQANMSPEDPINLENTDPRIFEAAMRFLYGEDSPAVLKDVEFVIEVFVFADKMQITSLIHLTENYVKLNLECTNVRHILKVFDNIKLCKVIPECKDYLISHARSALTSDCWLSMSADTVEAVLQMNLVAINELEVFYALIRWGMANVVSGCATADNKEDSLLRARVLPFLKYIHFESLKPEQAAEMLISHTKIFSLEEQNSILLAAVLSDRKYLPQNFSVDISCPARNDCIHLQVKYSNVDPYLSEYVEIFSFQVTQKMYLCKFSLSRAILCFPDRIFLYETNSKKLHGEFVQDSDMWYTPKEGSCCLLSPNITYKLTLGDQYNYTIWTACEAEPEEGNFGLLRIIDAILPVDNLHLKYF